MKKDNQSDLWPHISINIPKGLSKNMTTGSHNSVTIVTPGFMAMCLTLHCINVTFSCIAISSCQVGRE